MKFSLENPTFSSPEAPRDARLKRLLEAPDLRPINRSLALIFSYTEDQEYENTLPENFEADAAEDRGALDLAFANRYGENALFLALKKKRVQIKRRDAEVAEYREFVEGFLLAEPKERVRILAKMCYADEQAPYEERLAFCRFLDELYGREKKTEGQKEYFLALEGQLDLLEAVSIKQGWGLDAAQFDDARARLPDLQERLKDYGGKPLVAGVVIPHLTDMDGVTGVQRTYLALRKLEASGHMNINLDSLRAIQREPPLLIHEKGAPHEPGISLDILDLGANRRRSTREVRGTGKNLPNAGVLAAAATNPEWVASMDGKHVPYAVAPGYEMGENVPAVEFSKSSRLDYLSSAWERGKNVDWAVPVSLLEEAEA